MEWWENGYEPVDERQFQFNGGNYNAGMMTGIDGKRRVGLWNTDTGAGHSAKLSTLGKGAAGIAAAGGLAAGAKYLYNKNQKKKAAAAAAAAAQNQPAPTQPAHIKGSANTKRGGYSEFEGNGRVREDWEYFDDPGAQMILESYFSEFGDADVFGGPEPEYDNYNEEWDS